MAIFFDKTDRLIIPRWREFKRQSISQDHLPCAKESTVAYNFSGNLFAQEKIMAFENEKSVASAWELVNSAHVLNEYSTATGAAHFLKSSLFHMPDNLRKIVSEILNEQMDERKPVFELNEGIKSLALSIGKKIRQVKQRLARYIRNELLWIELARLYSALGNIEKANKCVIVALQLSNGNNRYITRSSSRFFYHVGDYEKAQHIIKLSPNLKNDPWLLSAEISYAIKQKKTSRFVKIGLELVNSKNYSNASISELAGMLGTLELSSADYKSARKLTNKSLLSPNDNSLAQAEWISRELSDISLGQWLDTTELAFEARALEFQHEGNYSRALKEGIDWVIDQPFSKRAIHFVSYLCIALTDNLDLAIETCEFGLKSNPTFFPIVNNLTFACASKGQLEKARKYLTRMRIIANSDRETCIYLATEGYVLYKSGEFEKGKARYQASIEHAIKKDLKDLKIIAESFLTREQFVAHEISFFKAKDILKSLMIKDRNSDINFRILLLVASIEQINKSRATQ